MFGESFQPNESLKAMIYFEGSDLHLLTLDTKEILAKAVSDNWDPRKSISDKGVRLSPALVFAYELAASARER